MANKCAWTVLLAGYDENLPAGAVGTSTYAHQTERGTSPRLPPRCPGSILQPLMKVLRLSSWSWVLASALACSSGAVPPPVDAAGLSQVPITHVELSREAFGPKLVRLLRDGKADGERLNDLVAVVRHQLGRAKHYFDHGHEQAGLDAVTGAFLLVRAGEFRNEMLQDVEFSVEEAAGAVARLGDEGRAEAFYELLKLSLEDAKSKQDVKSHLEAITMWRQDTSGESRMTEAGARRLAAAKKALVWRTPENLALARKRTGEWVEQAFVVGDEGTQPRTHEEFDERTEANRAVMLGAASMAALYLRDGDAAGAVAALESEPVSAIANTRLINRLNDAADGSPDAWADMFGFYESTDAAAMIALDPDLARGAAWGAAVELYRSEPKQIRAVIPLATLLVDHSMGDVAPLLFEGALGEEPDSREFTWVLRLVMQALSAAEERGDLELARQVFANARPLVERAAKKAYLASVSPSAADFWYAMGAMESRAGALERARPYLLAAVKAEATPQSLRLLAAIDRQRGELGAALQALTEMLSLVRAEGDATSEAATQVMIYDLLRQMARDDQAASALQAALERVLAARKAARNSTEAASAERVLADVLERYGDKRGANRAVARAEDAARHDIRQLTATLLDAARRALMLSDLEAGRRIMRDALDSDLDEQDLVYTALWVKLLHEKVGAASDGSYEEALARIDAPGTWAGQLRDWARGHATGEQLLARATTPVQQIEAKFYIALSAHLRQPGPATLAELQAVATSPAIELVEVRIARDFVAAAEGKPKPSLPAGVTIP